MMKNYFFSKYFLVPMGILVVSATLVLTGQAASSVNSVLLDANRNPAKDGAWCDITTRTLAVVGDDLTTEVLATSTNRAWARIAVGANATNTSYVEFNDIDATVNSPFVLNKTQGSGAGTTTPELVFGLTTPFPYRGVVNVLNDNGTSTVEVIECVYS